MTSLEVTLLQGGQNPITPNQMYIYKNIISIDNNKKSGKPCIRNMRITVEDILRWLSSNMTFDEILYDFTELTLQDILVALEFSANRNRRFFIINP